MILRGDGRVVAIIQARPETPRESAVKRGQGLHVPVRCQLSKYSTRSDEGMKKNQFDIDDLPRLSPWPARLLGLEPWEQRHKTPEDITREYEHEKWGPLLTKVREIERQVLVDEVDEWILKDVPERRSIYPTRA